MTKFHFNIVKKIAFFLAIVLFITAFFAGVPGKVDVVAEEKKTQEELEAEIESLKKTEKDLQAKIDAASDDIDALNAKKEYIDQLIAATTEEIQKTEELIEEYKAKVEAKQAEIDEMNAQIDEKFNQMMERLRYSYEEGNSSYLALIFEADDMSSFLSNVDNVSAMMDFDNSLMEELSAQLTILQNEKTALANTLAEQEQLESTLEQKKADLDAQIAASNKLIEELKSNQAVYLAELEKAKAAEEASKEELNKLITASNGTAQAWGGAYIWPVPKGYTRISSGYGWRVLWGRSDFHRGIDIPVPTGTDIYASAGGVVVTATFHYSWGNYVLINHGNGYLTLYAHNSSLLVRAGDYVSQGDVIARAGSTGSSSGPHCHFEVLAGNMSATCNPLSFVSVP